MLYVYVVYFVMYDSVLILLLSYGHHDWFNKVFLFLFFLFFLFYFYGMIIKDSITTDSPVGKSDHCMINFEFCCSIEDETFSGDRFSYFKGNYRDFSDHLYDVDWDNLFD